MQCPTPEEQALMQAVFRLRRTNFSPMFCQLTRAEFFILEYIHTYMLEHPGANGIYVSELAGALRVSSPAVSRALRPLEARGLIERHADRADRRSTCLLLTDAGEHIRLETKERMSRFLQSFVQRMGRENICALTRLLEQFIDIWAEEQAKENQRC